MSTMSTMRLRQRAPGFALSVWTGAVVLFVLGPLAMVLLVSLTPHDYISLPGSELSLRWYASMLTHGEFVTAALHSLWLALGASVTAVVLGFAAALGLARHDFRFGNFLRTALMAPLFVPMILSGLAILTVYAQLGWSHQGSRIFVAHTALTLPYVIRTITASLAGFDRSQELAAHNLGAGPWQTFRLVTLPQLGPGLFAGALFAFIVSFDNVGLSLFLAGTDFNTLPVQLFSYASYNNDPVIAAVSVTMILLSITVVMLMEKVFGLQRLMQ